MQNLHWPIVGFSGFHSGNKFLHRMGDWFDWKALIIGRKFPTSRILVFARGDLFGVWSPNFGPLGVVNTNLMVSWGENRVGKWSIILEVALCEAAHARKQHLKMFSPHFLDFSPLCILTLIALGSNISRCFLCIYFLTFLHSAVCILTLIALCEAAHTGK